MKKRNHDNQIILNEYLTLFRKTDKKLTTKDVISSVTDYCPSTAQNYLKEMHKQGLLKRTWDYKAGVSRWELSKGVKV